MNIGNMIPESIIQSLQNIAVSVQQNRWAIGDITNLIKALIKAHSQDVHPQDIYDFVSLWLNNEVAPRTVRYYAALADFFSPETRAMYDVLPHRHFAVAMQYGGECYWKQVLDCAMNYFAEYGHAPTEAWLVERAVYYQSERIDSNDHIETTPINAMGEDQWRRQIEDLKSRIPVYFPAALKQKAFQLIDELLALFEKVAA